MAKERDYKNFIAEFEALKAECGAAFADLRAVRFTSEGAADSPLGDFVPYSCRADDDGFMHCVKERSV